MTWKTLLLSWPLMAALLCSSRAATSNDSALWRPRFATPAIVSLDTVANRQFTAEVRASSSAGGWSVIVSNDLRAWTCQIVSATYSTINRGTEPGWRIKASVPPDTSPELFTLVVSSTESVSVQAQSVSVVPAFATDFYVLHIADEQIVNQMHTDPSGQNYQVGSWEEMNWMQGPVNLINPRFVMITGDQIDYNGALDGWNNWYNWGYTPSGTRLFTQQETTDIENRLSNLYQDCHKGYRVAYVETPGNHDVPPTDKVLKGTSIYWHPIAVPIYESLFGQRSYSFRMGDFYVLMHDWSESALKTWAAGDYNATSSDPTVKYRLIGQHYNSDQAFLPGSCDLMLVGHGHTTATLQSSPYYIYEDGPAFSYGTTGFFNFRRQPIGWTCDQTAAARNTSKDVWPLFTANGATMKVRTDQPDPMNLTTSSVTVFNDLPENFYDGRVRFIMNKGTYTAANGTVLAQYDCFNGAKTAVLVRVNIPASGSITVSLAASSSPVKPDPVDPQAFGSRLKLTFAGYNRGEPLTNFPALVTLGPSVPGFSYSQFASPTGADLRFTDASGTNGIFHEIDEWNTNGVSSVWVQVPMLSGPTDCIWAYWGSPASTNPPAWTTNGSAWPQNCELAWHLKDYADSTLKHPASSTAAPGVTSTGFIGHGALFGGSSYLDAGSVNLGNAFTLSAWLNLSVGATNIQTIWANKPGGWNSNGIALFVNSWNTADGSVRMETGDGVGGTTAYTAAGAVACGQWYFLTAVVDATSSPGTAHLYLNGVERTQSGSVYSAFATANDLQLGELINGASRFHGTLDEARVETQARSSNWVWASYLTVASNTVLASYSTVTQQPPSLSILTTVAGGLVLSWPGSDVGYSLYTVTNLTPPAFWTPVQTSPALSNGQWQTALPADNAGNRFYRLQPQ